MTYGERSRGSDPIDHYPVSVEWLRNRAAHYRQLITKTGDPRRVNRYRELSQLLDEAAEKLEHQN